MRKIKICLLTVTILIASLLLIGCDSETTGPLPITELAPPSNVSVIVDGLLGGSSFAIVTWVRSTDEGLSDFQGYVVITDSVDDQGNSLGRFDSSIVQKSEANFHNITGIIRSVLFQTSVYSINNNNRQSESSSSIVYSGVYVGDGTIDEYSLSAQTQSAFGWDPSTGLGTQYPYTNSNAQFIDLHMREASGQLTFYSPDAAPETPISGARTTQFSLLGHGEDSFNTLISDYADLTEPTSSSIGVTEDNVYLLRTADDIYIKVWINVVTGTDFSTVEFSYKLQPVKNLKVLKR